MRLNLALIAGALAACLCGATEARAQNFFGGGSSFSPQIGIVESGAKLDVQATVSADRKYVTMTLRPQVAQLVALREFAFQVGGGGVVGFPNQNPGANNGVGNARPIPAPAPNAPLMPALAKPPAVAQPTPLLLLEGMRRVDPLPGK
jgi:hypothetical protein